jgi:hypothetical protein
MLIAAGHGSNRMALPVEARSTVREFRNGVSPRPLRPDSSAVNDDGASIVKVLTQPERTLPIVVIPRIGLALLNLLYAWQDLLLCTPPVAMMKVLALDIHHREIVVVLSGRFAVLAWIHTRRFLIQASALTVQRPPERTHSVGGRAGRL